MRRSMAALRCMWRAPFTSRSREIMRAGELLEGLLEHVLAVVGRDHFRVERQPVERGQPAPRNALRGGFLLELADENGKAAGRIALRGRSRRGADEHGAGEGGCEQAQSFRHGVARYMETVGVTVAARGARA